MFLKGLNSPQLQYMIEVKELKQSNLPLLRLHLFLNIVYFENISIFQFLIKRQ